MEVGSRWDVGGDRWEVATTDDWSIGNVGYVGMILISEMLLWVSEA